MKTRNVVMTSCGVLLMGTIAVLTMAHTGQPLSPDSPDVPIGQQGRSGPVVLTVDFDEQAVLTGDTSSQVLVRVTGDADASTQRTPVSMAVVLDTSGSMSGNKIVNAQSAARELVERLHDGDILTLVGFNHDAYTVLNRVRLGADRTAAYNAIAGLSAGGGTCIQCGMQSAYTSLEESPNSHQPRVIVLSDGRGSASADTLQSVAAAAQQRLSVTSAAIGLGRDINEVTMGAIATGGTGDYYFMHNSGALADILNQELNQLQTTIASNVILELNPADGVTVGDIPVFGVRRDGNSLIVPVGNLSAGGEREFLVPLTLPEGALGQVISANLIFKDLEGTSQEIALAGELARTDDPAVVAQSANPAVVAMGKWMDSGRDVERAVALIEDGRRDEALALLRTVEDSLEEEAAELDSELLGGEWREVQGFRAAIEQAAPASAAETGAVRFNSARAQDRRRGRTDADRYYSNEANDYEMTE